MTPGMLMVPTSSHPTVPTHVKFRGWWPLVDVCGALSRISAGVQRCCMLQKQHVRYATRRVRVLPARRMQVTPRRTISTFEAQCHDERTHLEEEAGA